MRNQRCKGKHRQTETKTYRFEQKLIITYVRSLSHTHITLQIVVKCQTHLRLYWMISFKWEKSQFKNNNNWLIFKDFSFGRAIFRLIFCFPLNCNLNDKRIDCGYFQFPNFSSCRLSNFAWTWCRGWSFTKSSTSEVQDTSPTLFGKFKVSFCQI